MRHLAENPFTKKIIENYLAKKDAPNLAAHFLKRLEANSINVVTLEIDLKKEGSELDTEALLNIEQETLQAAVFQELANVKKSRQTTEKPLQEKEFFVLDRTSA